jgi:hypothetical protein
VSFDLKGGFDAEACAAIKRDLRAIGAGPKVIDAAFLQLENAARAYLTRSDAAMERHHIGRGLVLIDQATPWLRLERRRPSVADDNGATRRALEALVELRTQMQSALDERSKKIRGRKGTADPDLEQLYGAILRTWVRAGGKLGVATRTGGPLGRFFNSVVRAVTGGVLTIPGIKQIVRRLRGGILQAGNNRV